MVVHIERIPVVHARAPQMPVGYGEAQGMDQVQAATGERAHPAYIAGVLRDFGLEKDDVNHVSKTRPLI
jgi:hypothetical protein